MTDIVVRLNGSLSAGYSELRKKAAATITRLRAKIKQMEQQEPAPSVPDGWKLVPIEPTQEMRDAWTSHMYSSFRVAYQAMLAAAPEAK